MNTIHSLLRLSTLLTLAASLILPACSKPDAPTNTIKIGSLQSITGPTNTFGNSCDKGIRLAAEERNKAGGVLGKQIDIITADTESQQDKAKTAVLQLLDNDHVVAILGEVASSRTMAAAPSCQSKQIPMLTPASTNPEVTRAGDYIFRSCYIDDLQGKWIATFAKDTLHFDRAAVLEDKKQDYSHGLAKACKAEFTKAGGQIVGEAFYQSGDTDFSVPLTTLKATNPQIIFLPGYYSEVPEIVRKARELGITCPFIGGDGWESDKLLERGGPALDGCYYTTHCDSNDPDPAVQTFVKNYQAKYHAIPDAMATLGYDGANILFDAIKRADSTDGPKLRDALAATKDFPGVTGKITINQNRDAIKPGVMIAIKDGQSKMITRVQP